MSLDWMTKDLSETIGENSIEGYVTDAEKDVQLENYLEEQGRLEAADVIKGGFDTIAILKNMWVQEEKRNDGIGTQLLRNFIDSATMKEVDAIVLVADTGESNEFDLVGWYESEGFDIVFGEKSSYPVMVYRID